MDISFHTVLLKVTSLLKEMPHEIRTRLWNKPRWPRITINVTHS